jgi:hypothetical protein
MNNTSDCLRAAVSHGIGQSLLGSTQAWESPNFNGNGQSAYGMIFRPHGQRLLAHDSKSREKNWRKQIMIVLSSSINDMMTHTLAGQRGSPEAEMTETPLSAVNVAI